MCEWRGPGRKAGARGKGERKGWEGKRKGGEEGLGLPLFPLFPYRLSPCDIHNGVYTGPFGEASQDGSLCLERTQHVQRRRHISCGELVDHKQILLVLNTVHCATL